MSPLALDQDATNSLIRENREAVWQEIRTRIEAACKTGLLCCPFPFENLIETAPRPLKYRIATEEFFTANSRGLAYRPFFEIMVDETLKLVRPRHPVRLYRSLKTGWSLLEKDAELAASEHADWKLRWHFNMTSISDPSGAERMSPKQISNEVTFDRCARFMRDLKGFESNASTSCPSYETGWLMNGLVKLSLTKGEALLLQKAVLNRHWDYILLNFFDLRLGSRWNQRCPTWEAIQPKRRG